MFKKGSPEEVAQEVGPRSRPRSRQEGRPRSRPRRSRKSPSRCRYQSASGKKKQEDLCEEQEMLMGERQAQESQESCP